MDIKKMAELIRTKVQEADEAGIFDKLVTEASDKSEKPATQNTECSRGKGCEERHRS